jgi:predicted unusual protein kinase regulating ubiquinone biosynthesis (AarF/ABC1/UbiB family)
MKTFARLFHILWAVARYGLLPELKLTKRRTVPRPVRLRLALEELGATWIKLGQALAMRYDLLPASYCHELFQLFNEVAPFPYADVEQIIRGEFGRDVSQVFASFDPEPVAAASIGQVHRAALASGERVAVKVQRPGIKDLVSMDLRLMHRMAFLGDLTRIFGGTPTRDVIDEFARWLDDELDYVTEAMNADTIRANARFDPIEYNPKVWLAYSTERVLTMEYIDGILVIDILTDLRRDRDACTARMRAQGYDLDRVAANLVWNFLNQVYVIGLFHADLHPANLLVLPGNRIGYVDFGNAGRLPASARESLVLFARKLLKGDVDGAVVELTRWVTPSMRTIQRDAVDDLKALARRFLFELRATQQSRQALAAAYQIALLSAIRRHRMRVDPTVLSYVKAVITLDSITAELSPSFDLVEHELRFFSAMTLDGVHDFLRPAELADTVMDYRYRIDRALDFVDKIITEERAVTGILGSARAWIERLAFVAALGVLGVWLAERYSGHTRGVFSTNAGFVVVAVGAAFFYAVLRQTRKLPDTGGQSRRRHGLRRRTTPSLRNGWSPQPTTTGQSNGSAARSSGRPKTGTRNE